MKPFNYDLLSESLSLRISLIYCICRYGKEGGGFDLDDLDEDFDDLGIGSEDDDESEDSEEDQEE